MTRLQEDNIRRWFRAHRERMVPYYESLGLEDSRLIQFAGDTIYGGNEKLAEFIRRDGGDLPPLVRLTLPNMLTAGRHRLITRIIREEGGQTIAVPLSVLDSADIRMSSIEVIDAERRALPRRAPQQLIRARVAPRWVGPKKHRDAYFLSGYDLAERGLSYFFCELTPGAEPKTIEDAYQSLKPQSVKIAEAQRKKVKRQGDMYFIPMDRALPAGASMKKTATLSSPGSLFKFAGAYMHNTNHAAEELAAEGDVIYARGMVRHVPQFRRPDHSPMMLGRRWHIVVKNTVPIVGRSLSSGW